MSGQTTSYGQQPFGETGLTGHGTNQATALVLPSQINVFTSVPAGSGCRSPAIPSTLTVINDDMAGGDVLSWYPPSGDQISGYAVNEPIPVPAGSQVTLTWFGSALDPAPRQWVQFFPDAFQNGGKIQVTPTTNPLIVSGNTTVPSSFATATILSIIGATGQNAGVTINSFRSGGTGGGAFFTGRGVNGSPDAPSATTSGQLLVNLRGLGYGSTGYVANGTGLFQIVAAENWTDAAHGTYLAFQVTAIGGTTTAEAMRLQASGILTIGATAASGSANLQVTGGTLTDTLAVSGNVGFFGTAVTTKPTVTGSKGANAALTSLMTALAGLGLVVDSTS